MTHIDEERQKAYDDLVFTLTDDKAVIVHNLPGGVERELTADFHEALVRYVQLEIAASHVGFEPGEAERLWALIDAYQAAYLRLAVAFREWDEAVRSGDSDRIAPAQVALQSALADRYMTEEHVVTVRRPRGR